MKYRLFFLLSIFAVNINYIFAQNTISLTIKTQSEINFWEPLEFVVIFENRKNRKTHLTMPPTCKVEFRKQGADKWRRVQVNTSFGFSRQYSKDLYLQEKGDSLLLQCLLAPVPFMNLGLKNEYYFEPNENYELRYSYRLEDNVSKGHSYVVYDSFRTTGSYASEDYILINSIDDPIFLFYPSDGIYDREEKKKICQTILAQGGSTLSKWAAYYLLFWDFFERSLLHGDESLSEEEKKNLFEDLENVYFNYLEKVDSDFIRESFRRQHYYLFWKGPGTKLFETLSSSYGF